MFYKELFKHKENNKDILKTFLLVMATLSIILGFVAIILLIVALRNSGISLALCGSMNLEITSQVANIISGLIGTLLSFSSILFVILTIRLQQKEIQDSHIMQKNNAILELFYKSIDCIDITILQDDRTKKLIESEYSKFTLACICVHMTEVTNTIDLLIQTLPLEEKFKLLQEKLTIQKIEKAKELFDKANNDLKKLELLNSTRALNASIFNALLLMDSLSEDLRNSCFTLLKSKIGIYGNMHLLVITFLNQISWSIFKFYNLGDLLDYFHNVNVNIDNDYSLKITKLMKEYLKDVDAI